MIGETVGQFIIPKTKDQATMISYKKAPQLPKVSTGTGTSPMTSPKPSPPPTPKSTVGSPKPDPPSLPAEAADQPMAKSGLPFKAPLPLSTAASPRAPPQKSAASAASPSLEPAPKIAKKEPPIASAPPPGTGGPQPPAEPPLRPSGYPKWYFFSPGRGERRDFTIRCADLPGLRDLGRLNFDDFKFAKRVSGLLRGYDHKYLEPHQRIIPPEFDNQLYLNFEGMYSYLRKRYRAHLSKQDLYLILRTQDRFMCRIEAGVVGELTTLDMPYRITHVKACQGHDQTLIEKVGTAPLVKQIISLDYDFSVDDLAKGLYPRVPIYPHLTEAEVREEFRIIYHYTSWSSLQAIICTGIVPPGASSCKGHVYMTRHAPWEIDGKDPGVRTNRPLCLAIDTDCALHYGIRLVETLAGALICEDWIPNHCLIYAFDCEKAQYLFGPTMATTGSRNTFGRRPRRMLSTGRKTRLGRALLRMKTWSATNVPTLKL